MERKYNESGQPQSPGLSNFSSDDRRFRMFLATSRLSPHCHPLNGCRARIVVHVSQPLPGALVCNRVDYYFPCWNLHNAHLPADLQHFPTIHKTRLLADMSVSRRGRTRRQTTTSIDRVLLSEGHSTSLSRVSCASAVLSRPRPVPFPYDCFATLLLPMFNSSRRLLPHRGRARPPPAPIIGACPGWNSPPFSPSRGHDFRP